MTGFSGSQGEARRGGEVGPHAGRPHDAGLPAKARAHDEPTFFWAVLHHLGIVGLQALGDSLRRPVEQLGKRRVLQRHHAQVGQDLLLPDAQ
jgi:hypothetical protein